MFETIAILLLAVACYLVLRRLPLSGDAAVTVRSEARAAEKLKQRERIEAILESVQPSNSSDLPSSADAATAVVEPPIETVPEPVAPQYAPEVAAHLDEADRYFDRGELEEAEGKYIKICAIEPKIAHVYNRLGAIYLRRDTLEDAKEALEAGLKIEPMNGQILNNLGLVYFKQSKFTDSVRYYERSIRAERGIAARHLNLGLTYLSLRQYHKAAQQFKRASHIEPQNDEFKKLVVEAQEKYAESRVGMITH